MPENLKNVLLIMSSNGYLVPPSQNPEREELWNETWKRIDRFLPELRKDLDLDDPVVAQEPASVVVPVQEGEVAPAAAAPAAVVPEGEKTEGEA